MNPTPDAWAAVKEAWQDHRLQTVRRAWQLGGDLLALRNSTPDEKFTIQLAKAEIPLRTATRYMELRQASPDGVPSLNAAIEEILKEGAAKWN